MKALGFATCAALLLSSACGYAPMSARAVVPETVREVYVDADAGDRGDPELADAMERSLRRLVRREGRFRLAADEKTADAVLRVVIDSTQTRPVAFDEFDDPLDYETTVTTDARLESGGKVLWSAADVGATRAHAAVAGAVVTSSSAFVSTERLRPNDLAAFDTVQLGEERLAHSRDALANDLATTIYLRMMEGR
jgi:hypothetical protein